MRFSMSLTLSMRNMHAHNMVSPPNHPRQLCAPPHLPLLMCSCIATACSLLLWPGRTSVPKSDGVAG
jgi:hypothetical protein